MKNGAVHRSIAAGALALVAAGCGGGGDAAPSPPPQGNTVAASAAHRDLLASARSRAVTGVGSDNRNYRLDLVITPLAAAAFPATGRMAARSVLQLDVAIDGQPSSQGRLTYHFDLADMRIVGVVDDRGPCQVPTAVAAVFAATLPGTSGPIAALDVRADCTADAATVRRQTLLWSVEVEGSTLFYCLNAIGADLQGNVLASESYCLEASPSGAIGARARITVTTAGATPFSLVARNY
jgi:hypothetical protein